MAIIEYETIGDIAIVTLNNPPVNGLSLPLRRAFIEAMGGARADPQVRAIVLAGNGKGFCAGGDIREFGTPEATALPGVSSHMHPAVEESTKPVIAAIHGLAMGGGLETAMVCHYRIAMADAKIALPEVRIGTIPLSGTQRMPRLIGLRAAIDMIAGAKSFVARDFTGTRLFDRIVEPVEGDSNDYGAAQVRAAALAFARDLLRQGSPALPLIRDLPFDEPDAATILADARVRYAGDAENPAPLKSIDAIAASVEAIDFDDGIVTARKIWRELMESEQVSRLRDKFFAERRAKSA